MSFAFFSLPMDFCWPSFASAYTPPLKPALTLNLEEAKALVLNLGPSQVLDRAHIQAIRRCLDQLRSTPSLLDGWLKEISELIIFQNASQALVLMSQIVSIDTLLCAVQSREASTFTSLENLAKDAVTQGLPYPDLSLKKAVESEWKKYRSIFIHFIPNLLNIFLGAFNFLDAQKKFTTLWEKHLLLDIIYKFFVIPLALVQILQPIFVIPAKVYLVATLTLFAVGALLASYQRWLKPLPNEIVNCTNLDKQMERGVIGLKAGSRIEMQALIAKLQVHDHIVLRAPSGEGKTALVHHFIQLKEQGKLPQDLQDKVAFEVDCGTLISSLTYGHAELISQIKEQISGFEDKVLMFFDDFYQIATNPAAFLAFKKRMLEDRPRCKCILAITPQEWEAIEALDKDYSFQRRVQVIDLQAASDAQTKEILCRYAMCKAKDVSITQKAIEKVTLLSQDADFLPLVGRIAKAKLLIKEAVAVCRETFLGYFKNEEIDLCSRQHIEQLAEQMKEKERMDEYYSQLSYKLAKIKNEEKRASSRSLAAPVSEKEQVSYLWYYFYGKEALKKNIESQIARIGTATPVQVSEALVCEVYDRLKKRG